jgi:hypothetical protein
VTGPGEWTTVDGDALRAVCELRTEPGYGCDVADDGTDCEMSGISSACAWHHLVWRPPDGTRP